MLAEAGSSNPSSLHAPHWPQVAFWGQVFFISLRAKVVFASKVSVKASHKGKRKWGPQSLI